MNSFLLLVLYNAGTPTISITLTVIKPPRPPMIPAMALHPKTIAPTSQKRLKYPTQKMCTFIEILIKIQTLPQLPMTTTKLIVMPTPIFSNPTITPKRISPATMTPATRL